MNSSGMAAKDYSFEPVGAVEPNAPVVEAIPSDPPQESYYDEEQENPSETAIMVGCGTLGWMIGGPFFAILTALGGKYAAEKSKGPIGESTKAVGRIASAAGRKAKEERLGYKAKKAIASLFGRKECPHCDQQEATPK